MPAVQDVAEWAYHRPWRVADVPEVTRSERSGPLWRAPHRGVRVWAPTDPDHPRERVLAMAAALPGTSVAGWAAAHLLGCTDLDGFSRAGVALPVPLCPGRSGRISPRPDRCLLRSSLGPGDVLVVDGVRCTSPVRTAFDLARTAASLPDAVAGVDAVLRGVPSLALAEVSRYTAARARWKGVDQARRALALADGAAASVPESWLRCVWVLDAGLPRPLVNVPVLAGAGTPLGRPDLLDLATGLVGEYDGSSHRSPRQQHADAVRQQQMAAAGLTFVRASAFDLGSVPALTHRLREAHERAARVGHRTWWVPRAALR